MWEVKKLVSHQILITRQGILLASGTKKLVRELKQLNARVEQYRYEVKRMI